MEKPVSKDEIAQMIERSSCNLKDFIASKFAQHEEVEMLLNDKLNTKIEAEKKKVHEVRTEIFGNGKAGIKVIVDRLWQDHSSTLWWLRGVGLTVVGKIIYDIVTK